MKVECESCGKSFLLPDDRLPSGKKVSFPCPGCRSKITLDLREKPSSGYQRYKSASDPCRGEGLHLAPAEKRCGELDGDALKKKILNSVKDLPPMPKIIQKARAVMDNPKSGFKEIAEVIETDQAIAAKVLQVSNSAYYGLSGMVTSIHQAAVVLGHKTLEQLITLVSGSSLLGRRLNGYRMGSGSLWQHSLAVALCSRSIARDRAPKLENDAFSVGLIHDAGKLVLDRYLVERRGQVDQALRTGISFLQVERKVLGFDHTELASDLCSKWQLPDNHVGAMRYHHHPSGAKGNPIASIVHLADVIAHRCNGGAQTCALDQATLQQLSLEEEDLNRYLHATVEAVGQVKQSLTG